MQNTRPRPVADSPRSDSRVGVDPDAVQTRAPTGPDAAECEVGTPAVAGFEPGTGARPAATQGVTRGVARHLIALGKAPLFEFILPNGRRADIAALDGKGRLTLVEVKSCEADYLGDAKWHDYLGFCDAFFFAVDEAFPRHLLPADEGLMIADSFDAAILRDAAPRTLAPARRKALTLRFARQAAIRAAEVRADGGRAEGGRLFAG